MPKQISAPRKDILAKTFTLASIAYFGLQLLTNFRSIAAANSRSLGETLLIFALCFVPWIFFFIAYKTHSKLGHIWNIAFESVVATVLALIMWEVIISFLKAFSDISSNGVLSIAAGITAIALTLTLQQLRANNAW
ncbi:MAG: hypothetical protein JWP13_933 [Candidatus Saccharibacteria bacterium]|nr:hypothetical protein [Candidatus Saccharibacteria bacterium]